MTTQLFVASTAFGLATVVAALDDGAFAPAERRILLLSHNAAVPETAHRIEEVAGSTALVQRFDTVCDYNEAIAPQHPSLWRPRAAELPMLQRYLSTRWSLPDDLHVILESIQVSPALTLCRIFPDARIDVYADGLMSYGPTRNELPALVASRVERLLHLDLVPGVSPVLLTEHGVGAQRVATDSFIKTIAALGPPPDLLRSAAPGELAVLLGQYLGAMGILTDQEETELHLDMVRGAVAAGFRQLVFKPHPTAPPILTEPLVAEARRLGARLRVHDRPELVETWFRSGSVGLVVGCFSTALMTAGVCYDLPVARVGTRLLLDRLRPYENSNRIPVTLVDATVPELSARVTRSGTATLAQPQSVDLGALVQAVSYCMQPERYPGLRPVAERLLSQRWPEVQHYFRRRLLTRLDLPGRLPARPGPRPLRTVVRRLLGPARSRQLARLVGRLRRRPSAPSTKAQPGRVTR